MDNWERSRDNDFSSMNNKKRQSYWIIGLGVLILVVRYFDWSAHEGLYFNPFFNMSNLFGVLAILGVVLIVIGFLRRFTKVLGK
jgi:hypothetical protein